MPHGFAKNWTPYDLGRDMLRAWWCADDHDTARMTDDGAGLISNWVDRISGIAVTAATTARPTYGATALPASAFGAAKPGLTFNGTANAMVNTSFAALPTGAIPGEMWASFSNASAAGDSRSLISYGGSAADTFRALQKTTSAGQRAKIAVSETQGASTLIETVRTLSGVHLLRGQFTGTTLAGQLDGTDMTPASTAGAPTLNTGTTRMRIGASNGAGAANFWNGPIRHIIVLRSLLPAREATLMRAWQAADLV